MVMPPHSSRPTTISRVQGHSDGRSRGPLLDPGVGAEPPPGAVGVRSRDANADLTRRAYSSRRSSTESGAYERRGVVGPAARLPSGYRLQLLGKPFCREIACMVALQIRNVPEDIRPTLAERAAARGQSLQACLFPVGVGTDEAHRSTNLAVLERFGARQDGSQRSSAQVTHPYGPARVIRRSPWSRRGVTVEPAAHDDPGDGRRHPRPLSPSLDRRSRQQRRSWTPSPLHAGHRAVSRSRSH